MLERLERIEALDRGRVPPEDLLAELRSLVAEAEAWARREGVAAPALERCRESLRMGESASED